MRLKPQTTQIKLPLFILLSKESNTSACCDACGRSLKHVYTVKNTETNEEQSLGSGCVKEVCGKSISDIITEKEQYDKVIRHIESLETLEKTKKAHKTTFKELNPEMLEYIESNLDNSFIRSMKERIEETGTLTNKMFSAVYSMMLPVADLPEKFKNLEFKVIRFKKTEGEWGPSYTLYGEVQGKLIRIFFSSMNDKHNELFLNSVYDYEGYAYDNLFEQELKFKVSGSFDGYKIKRAKVEAI
jgi:hypothetical protein